MSWTWENWKLKREIVHRNKDGTFAKGNLHLSLKWRKNLSKNHLGFKRRSFYTHIVTKETRMKISKSMKGKKNSLGHKQSKEHKKKISIANKNSWRKRKA